jgi:hypothetical protein
MNCVSATTACPRRCVFTVVWLTKGVSTVLVMLVINPSITLGFKLKFLPRTEGTLICRTLKFSHDRTVHQIRKNVRN